MSRRRSQRKLSRKRPSKKSRKKPSRKGGKRVKNSKQRGGFINYNKYANYKPGRGLGYFISGLLGGVPGIVHARKEMNRLGMK